MTIICENTGNGHTKCGRSTAGMPTVDRSHKVTCACCQAEEIVESKGEQQMKAITLPPTHAYVTANGARAHIVKVDGKPEYLAIIDTETLCRAKTRAIYIGQRLVNDFQMRRVGVDIQEICPACTATYAALPSSAPNPTAHPTQPNPQRRTQPSGAPRRRSKRS